MWLSLSFWLSFITKATIYVLFICYIYFCSNKKNECKKTLQNATNLKIHNFVHFEQKKYNIKKYTIGILEIKINQIEIQNHQPLD